MRGAVTLYDKLKKTVKHTLIYGVGSAINSAFGFLLVPLYARRLKASEYGILALLTITMTLVSTVLKFGLNHAFFRHYYDTEDDAARRRIVGTTLVFLLVSTTLLTAPLYFLAPHLAALIFEGNASLGYLFRLVFFIGFFDVLSLIPDSILRARFHSARYSALNIVSFLLQIALIAYFVLAIDDTVENVLLARLLSAAASSLMFYVAVGRALSLSFSFTELRGMLAFGAPLVFGTLASTLFMMIDRFFLEHYSTRPEVGVYAMASSLVGAVTMLVTMPFAQVWTVMRFKVMNEDGAEEYYAKVLTYIVYVSMFFSLGIAAVAGDGLRLYALKSYYPVANILPMLAMAAVLDSASRVLNVGITLRKRTIYGPLLTLVALGFNLALNFWLIPRYGSLGATIATLFSYLLFCALRYSVSNLFFKVRYEWSRVFTVLAVGALLLGSFHLVDYWRGDNPTRAALFLSLAGKAVVALSFPLLLWALKFYDAREVKRLAEIWQLVKAAVRQRRLRAALLP